MTYFFSGTVTRVIYDNPTNFFKIILLEIEDTDSDFDDFEIIVTGVMADIFEEENYTFWGELTKHPKYGEQLKMSRYEREKPSKAGLINYFSSQQFKGIGKKTAEKIITLYGEDPIDSILKDPSHLDTISGLSKVNKEAFLAKLKINYGTEQILSKLAEYGLKNQIAIQVFESYKERTLDIITKNPYQLVEDVKGIGFKMADQLAQQLGVSDDSPERFQAAILHALLETSLETGDTYVEAKQLLEKSLLLLEEARQTPIPEVDVANELRQLLMTGKIQNSDTKIFDNSLFFAESGIKKHIERILDNSPSLPFPSVEAIKEEIKKVELNHHMTYDDSQKEAIEKALTSKIFFLTGGPGTGKTTIINGIIQSFANLHELSLSDNNSPIILAAPTGRAARRMNELTGLPSATIHRHLGLNSDNDYQILDDYLDAHLIIIDEFSMVDTWLANQLFSAISSSTQVIIVGDSDQLPSVGPGQVLADLLEIDDFPKVSLKKIFRQSNQSTIVDLASKIREGVLPNDFTTKQVDRSYFECQTPFIPESVAKIVSAALKNGIAAKDIQILAPMYRGQAGITYLNELLQELVNPLNDQLEFSFNDNRFRVNDKVLHLVNDPESNVFNGDIGYITELIAAKYTESKQDEMTINFDGVEVTYARNDWHKLTLAYAMSIHKAQGSEFPVVILPITQQSSRMLQRNLLYTAITRAKHKLVMLGDFNAFQYATQHVGSQRNTFLIERFKPEKVTEQITTTKQVISDKTVESSHQTDDRQPTRLTEQNLLTIDPMIGLSQEDFDYFFKS
ncbi:ATP-dependent RecD-like DNA helicase [Streptococcus sp. CSL10205-OR2]|uniref:SF1B family DNA helicase RecD2 n=1 Tax=Streptococcus sp. CSL10205-OR2 TaxID=2980558 RepID=UPI0021DB5999|nr:ATP-dependent RecD-like DNA helicase [Streptococcus sp. CSL10205-OR2]MCU9533044.1 ATP-dependent RecD-like DNA helicase [Streptococcus sp. CSL10205-OR2]